MKMDANQRGKEDKSEWEISFEKRRKREREKKEIEQDLRRRSLSLASTRKGKASVTFSPLLKLELF